MNLPTVMKSKVNSTAKFSLRVLTEDVAEM